LPVSLSQNSKKYTGTEINIKLISDNVSRDTKLAIEYGQKLGEEGVGGVF
jgi:hypothetical protein